MTETYKIIRFFEDDREQRIIATRLTLEEAKAHCSKESTHSHNRSGWIRSRWFDGFTRE